jgi:drug/metabolite transporter (DMT)-like permease
MDSIVLAVFIACLWGISPIIFKYVLGDVDMKVIMVLTALFYIICVVFYAIPSWRSIYNNIKKINRMHLLLIAVNAAILTFLANLLFLIALKNNSQTYAVTAVAFCAPLFSLLIAFLFLNQQISWAHMIGMALTVGGIFILSFYK